MIKSRVNNLQSLLTKAIGKEFEIIDEKTTVLTAPGEHYGSVMLALEVTIKRESGKEEILDLVAKLIPANAMLRIAFDIFVTFKKEVIAYTESIPALVRFQKEYNTPEASLLDKLLPKCYGARICLDKNKNCVDEDGVLIFENLKLQGYRTEDRLVGFNFEAASLIVQDLARFHAVPIALKLLKRDVFDKMIMPALERNKGLEQLPPEVGLAFHNSIMEGANEVLELQPYLERIQKVVDYAAANPYVNRPPPNEPWGTMAHSDYWTSNTMLLRDQHGKAICNKIVDLQIMTYASAVRDLVFFLFTSVINSILDQQYDELVELYYQSFISALKQFEVDLEPFSPANFIRELNEVGPTEMYHVLVMLKPICTERGKVQNSAENFVDSDWSRKDLLGPNHRRKLRDTVLAFVKRKWI